MWRVGTIWPAVAVPSEVVEIEVNSPRERTRLMDEPVELLQVVRERSAAMTSARTAATAAALTATLGLAAASWLVAVVQMNGRDMGAATRLGSRAFFAA